MIQLWTAADRELRAPPGGDELILVGLLWKVGITEVRTFTICTPLTQRTTFDAYVIFVVVVGTKGAPRASVK